MARKKKAHSDTISERFYSEQEVAELLGIAVPTLRNRISAQSNHPPFKRLGVFKWFDKAEFWKWFDKANPTVRAS